MRKLSLLIVEDDADTSALIKITLQSAGHRVSQAPDGQTALRLFAQDMPDVVLLDVMMPKMNGFEVCDQVKNTLKLAGTYIILLTAKGQEFDKVRGREVGADLYMTKPFNPDEVVAKAREITGIR